jgi:tetratricopeptide (TPR) repeat protein
MSRETPADSCPSGAAADSRRTDGDSREVPTVPEGLGPIDRLPPAELLEAVLADQRTCWQRGERVGARAYFERYPALRSAGEAAADLVYQEYLLRTDAGEAVAFEEVVRQFPEYAGALQVLYEADHLVGGGVLPTAGGADRPARFGDYELLEEIARGGMGVVYKARQISLNRTVALKMILTGELASPADVQRFRNEALAAASLQHPNIVAIHEVGEHQGRPFFSMDYVAGPTLAQLVREHPLPAERATGYVETVARAVQHAHENGVLHRDLKPANVLLDADDRPRVTDFGLARRVEGDRGLTGTGQVLGTPAYMPPEQASGRNREVTRLADVYSLGAILYELLTARPPFRGETPLDTLRLVLDSDPVAPRLLNPRVPPDLETVCLKCLHKEPARRYTSAAALADDLGRFRRKEPVQARPVGRVERLGRWCRRNPRVAGLAAALVAVFVVGLAAVLWQWRRAEREAAAARHDRDVARVQEQRADANARRAHDAVGTMLTRVGETRLSGVPHLEGLRRELLEDALRFNLEFLRDNKGDPAVRRENAMAYGQVGAIREALGDARAGEDAFRQAVRLLDQLAAEFPDRAEYRADLAGAYDRLAVLLARRGAHAEAEQAQQETERLIRTLRPDELSGLKALEVLAVLHNNQSLRLALAQRPEEALQHSRQAVALLRQALHDAPDPAPYQRALATALNSHAANLARSGRVDEALSVYREALTRFQEVLGRSPSDPELRAPTATVWRNLARAYRRKRNLAAARDAYRPAQAVLAQLTLDFPGIPLYHSELAETLQGLYLALDESDLETEGPRVLGEAVRHGREAHRLDDRSPVYRHKLCGYLFSWGGLQVDLGNHRTAFAAAVEMAEAGSEGPDFFLAARLVANCIPLAEADRALAPDRRRELVETYAARAVAILREPVRTGKIGWKIVKAEPAFARLGAREEFRKLLAEAPAEPQDRTAR